MSTSKRGFLIALVVALLVLALGTSSVLAATPDHPGDPRPRLNVNFVQVAADSLDMSLEDFTQALRDGQTPAEIAEANGSNSQALIDALSAAAQVELDALVANGTITQEQADRLLADLQPMIARWVNEGPPPRRPPDPCRRMFHEQAQWVRISAQALGVSIEDFLFDLHDGHTPAQVAEADGSDGQALIDAITADLQARLDQAVANGRISQEQADHIVAKTTPRIERWVNDGPPAGGVHRCRQAQRANRHWTQVSADTLGMDVADFVAALRDGQTPAQIAEANDSDGQALIDAITADLQARLDQAVANGRISQEQADRIVAEATPRIEQWVDNGPPWPPVRARFSQS